MAIAAGQLAALETSVYGEVINRVAQTIIDLDLTSIKGRVYVLQRTFDPALKELNDLPLITVSNGPESAVDNEGPVNTSTVHYPVLVAEIWGTDRGQRDNWADQLLHRQQIARAFRKNRPTWSALSDSGIKKTTIKSGEPYVDAAVRAALDAQWWLIDVTVDEPLG